MDYSEIKKHLQNWTEIVQRYQTPSSRKAVIQILTSFLPFLGLWVLMYLSLSWSYWITLGLGLLNGFFLVRIFIIQHDCGHQSFFKSRRWNNAVGYVCSFFSAIPYKYWARSHNFHHAHAGQLEHREIGDISVLTVKEYEALSPWGKFRYRLYRSAPVMFVLGPMYYLLVPLRLPLVRLRGWERAHVSQLVNNVLLVALYVSLGALLGWKEFFAVQLTVIAIFAVIAIWFFYVQHQHEETYKAWKENWEYLLAAIKGSTYYKLPRVFQWLTGNIGFHHIHHLSSLIPNYNLEWCARENPILNRYVTVLTFRSSLKCIFNHLWDEERQQMISFREFNRRRRLVRRALISQRARRA